MQHRHHVQTRRLDEVTIFGGHLRFLIPHEWIEAKEEEADDYYCQYQLPDAKSGFFRVSLFTKTTVQEAAEFLALDESREGAVFHKDTGNWVRSEEKDSQHDGDAHLYFWIVGKAVSPTLIRKAVFSYTVVGPARTARETARAVRLIESLVIRAQFPEVE